MKYLVIIMLIIVAMAISLAAIGYLPGNAAVTPAYSVYLPVVARNFRDVCQPPNIRIGDGCLGPPLPWPVKWHSVVVQPPLVSRLSCQNHVRNFVPLIYDLGYGSILLTLF